MEFRYNAQDFSNRQMTPLMKDSQHSPPPQSPRCEEFLDLEVLDAKLRKTRPATPIFSSAGTDSDFRDSIDESRETLVRWGLSFTDIDRARRWDQKPLHRSGESIHMKLLSECAESIFCESPSLRLLHNEYDKRMDEYNRRKYLDDTSRFVQDRAQSAIDQLISHLLLQGSSAREVEKYYSATSGGEATMELVAEYCEDKLRELRRKDERLSRLAKHELARRKPRRSKRIQKLARNSKRNTTNQLERPKSGH
ncbi:MAG: hypothetical protein M1825_003300 [Sarcosagium campestre]|nr:MAG: hypothetical protein M1825_003300 [Sarcosagium campestre]